MLLKLVIQYIVYIIRGPFYPLDLFSQINRAPPPCIFARAKRVKAIKLAREARIKNFALTFETCRSSDV
jgi:hypothetical protein